MHARPVPHVNTEELQRLQLDHGTIRTKLQQLKCTLNGGNLGLSKDGARIQQDARALCLALARQLRAHIRHEGRLATRCSMVLGRMGPEELARLALEHHVDHESLRIVNQLLAHERNGWFTHVGPLLISLIGSLKRQMDAQEVDLFPFMERVLAVDHQSNGATQIKGSNGMEQKGAWERPVTSREGMAGLRNNGREEMEIENENRTDRNGDAAGGVDRLVHSGAGG